jgi:peptide deformylase
LKPNRILSYGDPRLSVKSTEVTRIDQKMVDLVQGMFELLYIVPGIGIAAPQVGCNQRFFVFDMNRRADPGGRTPVTVINPVISAKEGSMTGEEGCLSFPGIFVPVERAFRIEVKGIDMDGKELVLEGEGLFARLIQHEMDHLEGVLLSERMTRWDKIRLRKEIRAIEKDGRKGKNVF